MRTFVILISLLFPLGMAYCADDHGHAHGEEDPHHADHKQDAHGEEHFGSLEIPQKTQDLIGLKTQVVEASLYKDKITVSGRIAQDFEHVVEVYAPQSGKLKECAVSLGMMVTKDQVICRMQSNSGEIEITAPSNGVAVADFAKAGDLVDSISPICTLADLSKLPASLDVYEEDAGQVKMGQNVAIYSTANSGKVFAGKIIFVSPRIDEESFTVKVRVEIENPEFFLKPGMFVRGEIMVEDGKGHLTVPSEAVQDLEGMKVVFLKDREGAFTPVKVDVKLTGAKQTLFDADIHAGDLVVTEGAYILKSKILEDELAGGHSH